MDESTSDATLVTRHENEAQVLWAQAGIEANRFAHKIVDSAERLNPYTWPFSPGAIDRFQARFLLLRWVA